MKGITFKFGLLKKLTFALSFLFLISSFIVLLLHKDTCTTYIMAKLMFSCNDYCSNYFKLTEQGMPFIYFVFLLLCFLLSELLVYTSR